MDLFPIVASPTMGAMSDGTHLLIPFASSRDAGSAAASATLDLPHLEKLLARLVPGEADRDEETSLSMPHERVLARACGLPAADGLIPWAAWEVARSRETGATAWAHITPCHWRTSLATIHAPKSNAAFTSDGRRPHKKDLASLAKVSLTTLALPTGPETPSSRNDGRAEWRVAPPKLLPFGRERLFTRRKTS